MAQDNNVDNNQDNIRLREGLVLATEIDGSGAMVQVITDHKVARILEAQEQLLAQIAEQGVALANDISANVTRAGAPSYITATKVTSAATADQVIISYTVPAGSSFWIFGYILSSDSGVVGNPVKIGRTPVTTEPAAPGQVNANLFREFTFTGGGGAVQSTTEQFVVPRKIAGAGDTVVMTVTPATAASTAWRATIDFELRPA